MFDGGGAVGIMVNFVVLVCVLKATTKNGRLHFEEKSAPRIENPGYTPVVVNETYCVERETEERLIVRA